MVTKLVLDMDPGIDDALALLAACCWPQVDLLGVSVVAGNLPLETVTANASGILRTVGAESQVYKGASMPLHGKLVDAADIHGAQGLGYWQIEADSQRISSLHAVQFLAETARKFPHAVTLVATGPLTNVALALEHHPKEMEMLAGVVLMGGALTVPGNVTPVAEYNIYADPDAAELVINSGLNLTMVGLDVTKKVFLESRDLEILSSLGEVGQAVAAMASYYLEKYPQLPLHDPLALLAAVRPELFEFQEVAVKIETRGEHCRGQTLVDWDGSHGWSKNVKVALGVDAQGCRELLMDLWGLCI